MDAGSFSEEEAISSGSCSVALLGMPPGARRGWPAIAAG